MGWNVLSLSSQTVLEISTAIATVALQPVLRRLLIPSSRLSHLSYRDYVESHHEKTCLCGLRPVRTGN